MDVPFTKINLTLFMTYITILANKLYGPNSQNNPYLQILYRYNKLLGAVTFNTSMGILVSWESVRVLYPTAANHFIQKTLKLHNISRSVFEFINFTIHMFPILYLLKVRKDWIRYSKNFRTIFLSLLIHGSWIKLVPKHYNLNRVYMYNDPVLTDKQWRNLWLLAFLGHIGAYTYSFRTISS